MALWNLSIVYLELEEGALCGGPSDIIAFLDWGGDGATGSPMVVVAGGCHSKSPSMDGPLRHGESSIVITPSDSVVAVGVAVSSVVVTKSGARA